MDKYKEIYEKYSEKIVRNIGDIIFVSKKWSDTDLIWPFSDLDIRIILEEKKFDFFEINEKMFEIHKNEEKSSKINQRILEHTPGYIFTEQELLKNRIEDVNNWSFCYGDKIKFNNLKEYYKKKYNKNVDYYKKIILKRYKKFSLSNEFEQYKSRELYRYKVYCVMWHYYMPCLYAIYSISSDKIKNRKIDESLMENAVLTSVYNSIKNNSIEIERININELVKIVDEEISKELNRRNIDLTIKNIENNNLLEAISMLRTRICRYKLYLDKTLDFDRNYLINREIDELKFIVNEINTNLKVKEIEELVQYVHNNNNTPRQILEYALEYFYKNKSIFNNIMNTTYM